MFTRDELETIATLCRKWDVVAFSDEIYEHIIYDGAAHVPIATLPGMADRTVTINALSKTYSVTGWRVGWTIASPSLTGGIRKVHDFLTVGAAAPLQEAGAVALAFPDGYYRTLAADYLARRDLLLVGLAGRRIPVRSAARRVLHPRGRRGPGLPRRRRVRAAPHRNGRRRFRSGLVVLLTPGAGPDALALRVPEARGRRLEEARRSTPARPGALGKGTLLFTNSGHVPLPVSTVLNAARSRAVLTPRARSAGSLAQAEEPLAIQRAASRSVEPGTGGPCPLLRKGECPLSDEDGAAVDVQDLAGDERGELRGEERDGARDLVGGRGARQAGSSGGWTRAGRRAGRRASCP